MSENAAAFMPEQENPRALYSPGRAAGSSLCRTGDGDTDMPPGRPEEARVSG